MTTVTKGRWYPSPAPQLDGEDSDAYTDRLAGVLGEELRPYDHPRNRQCSIGWHTECSDLDGGSCKCPCHHDSVLLDKTRCDKLLPAAVKLRELYGLPRATGMRVMSLADSLGPALDEAALRPLLEEAYGPQPGKTADWFLTDAVKVYAAAAAGTLR